MSVACKSHIFAISVFVCLAINAYGAETSCEKLALRLKSAERNFRPPLEGKVVGGGRVYFYTAPAPHCRHHRIFVVPGDSLTVYKPHEGWYEVMYITKDGDDFIGWIAEDRVKILDQLGGSK